MSNSRSLSRLIREALDTLYNTFNDRTVEIFFQSSPGPPTGGGTRGVANLQYRVRSAGRQRTGTTGNDGRMRIIIRGGSATLELLHNNNPVGAQYQVSGTSIAFRPATEREGQKQRLRRLGYHIGHAGPEGNGVDANNNFEFERSVLDFQVDEGQAPTADTGAAFQNQLTTRAGG